MTGRRAQKRDGTRKSRRGNVYLEQYIREAYESARDAWLADRSLFRPVDPPATLTYAVPIEGPGRGHRSQDS